MSHYKATTVFWTLVVGSLVAVLDGTVAQQEVTACKPKACQNSDNQKTVCGSDGLTYPNRCMLDLVRCQNANVTLVKRGSCKRQRSCLEWEGVLQDFPQYRFKARCKANGAYEPGQCHPESDYCWCVTPEGLPIPNTAREKNKKPGSKPIRCGGGKKKIAARSPTKIRKTTICTLPEQTVLYDNLIQTFHSEYVREFGTNNSRLAVVTWKFKTLDSNRDQTLDKREYRYIKRLVSKAKKPKKCAKLFPKSCDFDKDGVITIAEWGECLLRFEYTSNVMSVDVKVPTESVQETSSDQEEYDYDPVQTPPHGVLNADPGTHMPLNYDEVDPREEEIPGCMGDRKAALDDHKVAGAMQNTTYIPECTFDGRYKKIQCYESVGYCWCVNEDTGQSIPGTSVKGPNPNCDMLKSTPKPMKGCPEDKKLAFLQELIKLLHAKISESVTPNNPAASIALIQSKEEQVLWGFNFFDKNKNKVLERSEWKEFKNVLAQVKSFKKCGRKLPRYCDSNKDKEISTTEWLECLNVQGLTTTQPIMQRGSRRGLNNPLNMLKE